MCIMTGIAVFVAVAAAIVIAMQLMAYDAGKDDKKEDIVKNKIEVRTTKTYSYLREKARKYGSCPRCGGEMFPFMLGGWGGMGGLRCCKCDYCNNKWPN